MRLDSIFRLSHCPCDDQQNESTKKWMKNLSHIIRLFFELFLAIFIHCSFNVNDTILNILPFSWHFIHSSMCFNQKKTFNNGANVYRYYRKYYFDCIEWGKKLTNHCHANLIIMYFQLSMFASVAWCMSSSFSCLLKSSGKYVITMEDLYQTGIVI